MSIEIFLREITEQGALQGRPACSLYIYELEGAITAAAAALLLRCKVVERHSVRGLRPINAGKLILAVLTVLSVVVTGQSEVLTCHVDGCSENLIETVTHASDSGLLGNTSLSESAGEAGEGAVFAKSQHSHGAEGTHKSEAFGRNVTKGFEGAADQGEATKRSEDRPVDTSCNSTYSSKNSSYYHEMILLLYLSISSSITHRFELTRA